MAAILVVIIIFGVMHLFFKFMYPKPPVQFLPQAGDDTTLKTCDYCHNTLAAYRGIVYHAPDLSAPGLGEQSEWFFCNAEHRAAYFAQQDGATINAENGGDKPPKVKTRKVLDVRDRL